MKKLFLGAYVTSPTLNEWDERRANAYWKGIREFDGVAGLEHPYWQGLHRFDDDWFLRMIDPRWDFVFTCLPGTMQNLERDPGFGLAAAHEASRQDAVRFIAGARDAARRLNDFLGRRAVLAVQLHSAPRQSVTLRGTSAAFARSLGDIAAWDWDGAELCVEHCDAFVAGQMPEKGFLALADEIAAVQRANAEGAHAGLTINWGRSAIEGRGAATPLEHLRQADAAGLLRGLFFSGASGRGTPYGVWKDSHMAVWPNDDPAHPAAHSLLTRDRIAAALRAIQPASLAYLGVKVAIQPQPEDLAPRLRVNIEAMRMVDEALAEN